MNREPPPLLIPQEWEPPFEPLPTIEDFDAHVDHLDAKWAWGNFGGLTRPEAFIKFLDQPLHYQEDFMWMGELAFVYYYPVIERYLAEFRATVDNDDSWAWILACGIQTQFLRINPGPVQTLRLRVLQLAAYVRSNLDRLATEVEEQDRIDGGWQVLQALLTRGQE